MAKATVKAGSGTANTTTYTYVAGATLPDVTDKTSTTGLVASIKQTGGNFTYEYDDNGNIISVVQDGKKTSYAYDALGQLIRVDDDQENATWVYTYDQGGNILSKTKHVEGKSDETTEFSYTNPNWKDQLKYVNGVELHYDNIGNLTNDGTWMYTWQNGRQLQKMQKSGETVSFVYNENGLRVQKTATSTGTTNYTLYGKNIVHMTQGSNELHFFYDAQNKPAVVVYNGTPYSYVKNLQGDIVAILDSSKKVVVSYVYDAWGRPIKKEGSLATSLGTVQPFRYRGYVYDEETGLHYLRSRYYKSVECRFINADSYLMKGETFDLNCFVYSMNRPVMFYDPNGTCSSCASIEQLVSRKTVSDNDFNDTVTLGMRKLLYNANDYYYVGKSKTKDGGIDCIWAVNKAVGEVIAKKVDSAWSHYAQCNTPRGRIYDLNDLQPGDIVFSIDRRDRYYGKDVADIPKIDPVSKGHIGVVVLFDFGDGNGEVLAVFQSCSVPLDPQEWTALYYGDTGPNITALADNEGNSNWKFYVRPK